jgi:hypothetical protein
MLPSLPFSHLSLRPALLYLSQKSSASPTIVNTITLIYSGSRWDTLFIMPPKRLLHSWNAETHEDVLIALLDIMKPVKEDWAKVMENLREKGYTFSEGALVYVAAPPNQRFCFVVFPLSFHF